jgi:hypothetical protein
VFALFASLTTFELVRKFRDTVWEWQNMRPHRRHISEFLSLSCKTRRLY